MDYNFVRGQFTESELEAAIIGLFQEQDYVYVPGDTIHRGFEETLLKDDMRVYLSTRYSDLTEAETETVIGRMENIPSAPLYQGKRWPSRCLGANHHPLPTRYTQTDEVLLSFRHQRRGKYPYGKHLHAV